MPLDLEDTIAALASPPGAAERGIVRISGTDAQRVVAQIFRGDPAAADWTSSRRATRFTGQLEIDALGVPLPAVLMNWPTARSFTGQPMAELHVIGSPPLLDAVLETLLTCGARPAKRGEFTMRAFLAGRIDLLQAEAVLGVIDATDHDELVRALNQLGGGITAQLKSVRAELISILGDLEAGLDFVDEDIEFITKAQICDRLAKILSALSALSTDSATRLPSGWRRRVVLAGLPNAGKSTLFNRLLRQQKAIVSPVPGTTRDYLTAVVSIRGVEAELIDTAGWETAADLIMRRAQEMRGEQVEASDLIVWCSSAGLSPEQIAEDRGLMERLRHPALQLLHVVTQSDRRGDDSSDVALPTDSRLEAALRLSAATGDGLDDFEQRVRERLVSAESSRGELLGATAVRCRDSLRRTIASVEFAIRCAAQNGGDELIALELRHALRELAEVMGEVYTDDILDHIFSHFCIGK